eukprot:6615818-Prymnesium_polylepis.1
MGGKASHVGKSFLIRFEIVCARATRSPDVQGTRSKGGHGMGRGFADVSRDIVPGAVLPNSKARAYH